MNNNLASYIFFIYTFIGIMILLLTIVVISCGWGFYSQYKFEKHITCFEDIAKQICEDRGLIFKGTNFHTGFYCKEDFRYSGNGIMYLFTEEEIERCYNE